MTRNQGFAATAAAVVLAAVVLGFLEAGPPALQRLRHADEIRLRDLSGISSSVSDYRALNKKLPAGLSEVQIRAGRLFARSGNR